MYNYEKEIKDIRWLNSSEERDPTWWEVAWSLVPASIEDPADDVSWDDLLELDELAEQEMNYSQPSAAACCIEAAVMQLRDKLPEDMQPEVVRLLNGLDTRDGDLEELINIVRENREEKEAD